MSLFIKPISCSLSPNAESDDIRCALGLMFHPGIWQDGGATEKAEAWFKDYFHITTAVSFNSGRSALLAILRAFDIKSGDEVLLQAFTCVAVPNSVRWAGAIPVYADIDESLNIDPVDIEKKITKKTKAIIVQHTFGIAAHVDKIMRIAKKYRLLVIEDCAHALGGSYKGKKLGGIGDAAFFSFGRDKVVSSVWGGMATISAKWKVQSGKLKTIQEELPMPGKFWIFQQLLHPIAFSIILASYNIWIGKIMLVILQKFRLLSLPVFHEERRGERPKIFPAKFPNALATLLIYQLAKIETYNKNRQKTAAWYTKQLSSVHSIILPKMQEGSIFLRYPLLLENPKEVLAWAKRKGLLLGNWYHNVIDPVGVDYQKIGYVQGSCLYAEHAAHHIINLPTRIFEKDAKKVENFFHQLFTY